MSVVLGDCLDVMPTLEAESFDAIVTDPPYGLAFMGKHWDHGVPGVDFWRAMLRVAKPSAYLLAFGGTRTVHRMTCAIEDAGWIIRDMLVWAYASGFPKSKASLKPAWEPIVMARKPGPLRMLAIDECRIPAEGEPEPQVRPTTDVDGASWSKGEHTPFHYSRQGEASASRRYATAPGDFAALPGPRGGDPAGRWPANVILTDPIFDGDVEGVVGGGETASGKMQPTPVRSGDRTVFGSDAVAGYMTIETYGDSGTYSRFFLIPKADRVDREPVLGGLPERDLIVGGYMGTEIRPDSRPGRVQHERQATTRANHHPTVKPVHLMRHLVRLVTPSGGRVLDPFLGSGTTGLAAEMEGFDWLGIEREPEYVAIANARLNGTQRGMAL